MNKTITPNPGDVYYSTYRNEYRMYVKFFESDGALLCINLNTGESYIHTVDNGKSDPTYEKFVFNMADLVTSNKQDDLWTK